MSGEQDNNVLEQRISLPKPDVENITVLTKSLPNEPVLPWHRFDSPWLERDQDADEADADAESTAAVETETASEAEAGHQLTLEFEQPISAFSDVPGDPLPSSTTP